MSIFRIAIGFIAGVLAVLTFQQGFIAVMYAAGLFSNPPFRMTPIPPFGVPAIVNLAFWGGIWGIVIVLLTDRLKDSGARVIAALIIGAVGATAVGWFIVAPLKGLPIAQGWNPAAMWRGPLINGAFGLGAGLLIGWIDSAVRPRG